MDFATINHLICQVTHIHNASEMCSSFFTVTRRYNCYSDNREQEDG